MDSINSSFCRKFSVLLHITPNVDESQSAARGFSQSPDDNRDDDLQYENNVMYHCGKRDILKRKYPHKGAFFRGSFFVARPAQKEENRLYIIILQRNLADSPNRKRKDRTKIPGLPELFGQPLSSFISCVTSSRRMIFLPDKASYTSVTCRRLCSSPAPAAGYSEKPCRSNPRASG